MSVLQALVAYVGVGCSFAAFSDMVVRPRWRDSGLIVRDTIDRDTRTSDIDGSGFRQGWAIGSIALWPIFLVIVILRWND